MAIFHLAGVTNGEASAFVRGSWLFVDFFFVLSGFVIAASYGARLAEGFGWRRFMLLRLGRVYPLHLAVLLAMVAVEVLAVFLARRGVIHRQAFAGGTSLPALFGSLGLVHIFGFWPGLVWNGPSWSIADEVWAYAIFAAVAAILPRRRVAVMALIAAGGAVWLWLGGAPWLDLTFSGSLARCLFGFGLGVLAWHFVGAGWLHAPSRAIAALAEALAVLTCLVFVAGASGAFTLFAPLLFLIAVLVFSAEDGPFSRLLLTAPLRWLGARSYSIYMIHVFVLARMSDIAALAERRIGHELVEPCRALPGIDCFVTPAGAAWLLPLVYLALLLPLSWLFWRLVEEPGRRISRRIATRG